jgi:hypothetical protein
MTQETQEKITPSKNIEEQERLKQKYEEESKEQQQKILDLENTITKKNDEIFELQKANKNLATERDDWKKEAHAARKVNQESKIVKEQNDFLTEFNKLQAKKGINIDN